MNQTFKRLKEIGEVGRNKCFLFFVEYNTTGLESSGYKERLNRLGMFSLKQRGLTY